MNSYNMVLMAVIIVFSIVCSWQDIKKRKVSVYVLGGACFCALSSHLFFNASGIAGYIISGIVSGLIYFATCRLMKDRFGMGDVFFGVFQGLCLPYKYLLVCIVVECVLGLIVMKLFNRRNRNNSFPFIPFMSAALFLNFVFSLFVSF